MTHSFPTRLSSGLAAARRRGCLAAAWVGQRILHGGGSALDAVEATVRELEDDPTFNAGRGSVLNAAGEVEMDAAIMDGATLDIGGVAAIRDVRHPVSVARSLLREIPVRSEEHTSELQSLMRISYAVFCLKKKNK